MATNLTIITNYLNIIHNMDKTDDNISYLTKIFDRLAFFASRFIHNRRDFLSVSKYLQHEDKLIKCSSNGSIVGHLLRGYKRLKLFQESISLWRLYKKSKHDNDIHPYIEMIRICSYNMGKQKFRTLGKHIGWDLSVNNYYNSQQLFDLMLNFWSGNDETTVKFIDVMESKNTFKDSGDYRFIRTSDTYCALFRCAKKNNDVNRALKYMDEIHNNIMDKNENLIKIIFNIYSHFQMYNELFDYIESDDVIYDNRLRS
eukprot:461391_1